MNQVHPSALVDNEALALAAEDRFRELVIELDDFDRHDVQPMSYTPPGPVAAAFINDWTKTSIIMGPLGGGKTTSCIFKRILAATRAPIAWHPETRRPTRMCKWIVLRDTFRSAERTVLESWKQWFPKNFPGSDTIGGNDRPFTHILRFRGSDGVELEIITEFAGLGEDSVETLMKGREYSGGWLNELDTHAAGALEDMEQRVGRYPKRDTLLTRSQVEALERELGHRLFNPAEPQAHVIGDMNAPTVDNWTFDALVTNLKPGRSFHQQPGGRSAQAENLFNLKKDYYSSIVASQEERFVRRMVDNQFGYSMAGKPVHPSFDHPRHVARAVLMERDMDLHIGVDASTAGLSPAAMFAQAWNPGRIAMLDELYLGHGVGPGRFGEGLKLKLNERFGNVARRRVKLWVDPAARGGADREADQMDAMETIGAAVGVVAQLPGNGSNELSLRLGAVDAELRGYLEPDTWLTISPACVQYIQAMAGRYRFRKRPQTGGNEFEDMPEKLHPWSDLMDAGQYVIIGIRGHAHVIASIRGGRAPASDGSGRATWSSQSNGSTGWGKSRGFDPHKIGSGR